MKGSVYVCMCVRDCHPQCSLLLPWSETPAGWRRRGSERKPRRPPRCGTTDGSETAEGTAGHKNHGEEFLIQACFLTGDRHSPRCHTCRGRTSRGFGRRTDRLRWCRAWPWGTASPSGQWWSPWSDPHWWQSAGWEPRHSDQGPQTHLNKEWTQSEYTSEQI